MSGEYSYEDRIVAFIDILGFKEKISNTSKDESKIKDIIHAYEVIREDLMPKFITTRNRVYKKFTSRRY